MISHRMIYLAGIVCVTVLGQSSAIAGASGPVGPNGLIEQPSKSAQKGPSSDDRRSLNDPELSENDTEDAKKPSAWQGDKELEADRKNSSDERREDGPPPKGITHRLELIFSEALDKETEKDNGDEKRSGSSRDPFSLPYIKSDDYDPGSVEDSSPRTRSTIDFRLTQRHGLSARDLSLLSRHHFSIVSDAEGMQIDDGEILKSFVRAAPEGAPIIVMVYRYNAEDDERDGANDQGEAADFREVAISGIPESRRGDVNVDMVGQWPRWAGGEKNGIGRVEVLYSIF